MNAVNLKAERLNRGLTTREVAEKVKVTSATIERIESGTSLPRPGTAKRLADLYGYKVTDIWPVEEKAAA